MHSHIHSNGNNNKELKACNTYEDLVIPTFSTEIDLEPARYLTRATYQLCSSHCGASVSEAESLDEASSREHHLPVVHMGVAAFLL